MDVRQLTEFTYSLNSILYSLYIPRVSQELQTTYKLSVFAPLRETLIPNRKRGASVKCAACHNEMVKKICKSGKRIDDLDTMIFLLCFC